MRQPDIEFGHFKRLLKAFLFVLISEIHSMAIHCAAAEHGGLIKNEHKKVNG